MKKKQCVFLGSTLLSKIKLAEMFENSCAVKIYNRSVEKLDFQNVSEFINSCAIDLKPAKLFINMGEEDIKSAEFNLETFITKYEWLLYQLHKSCFDCTLYIIPIISDEKAVWAVNYALEKLACETGCVFVKLNGMTIIHLLSALKQYLQDLGLC